MIITVEHCKRSTLWYDEMHDRLNRALIKCMPFLTTHRYFANQQLNTVFVIRFDNGVFELAKHALKYAINNQCHMLVPEPKCIVLLSFSGDVELSYSRLTMVGLCVIPVSFLGDITMGTFDLPRMTPTDRTWPETSPIIRVSIVIAK